MTGDSPLELLQGWVSDITGHDTSANIGDAHPVDMYCMYTHLMQMLLLGANSGQVTWCICQHLGLGHEVTVSDRPALPCLCASVLR